MRQQTFSTNFQKVNIFSFVGSLLLWLVLVWFYVCGTSDGTQDPVHARQVFYHFSYTPRHNSQIKMNKILLHTKT
jgi:hypothetical protein